MTAMSLRLPESLHAQLREMARKEGVSVNQYILMSVTERMARSEDYFAVRAARASAEKFDAALALVPDGEPIEEDKLPDRAAFLAVLDKAPDVPPLPGDERP